MFCPNCGVKVPEGNAFCEQCGERVLPAAIKRNNVEKTEDLEESVGYYDEQISGGRGIIVPDIDLIPESGSDPFLGKIISRKILLVFLILAMISAGVGFGITKLLDQEENEGSGEVTQIEEPAESSEDTGETPELEGTKHVIAGRGTAGYEDDVEGMAEWVKDGARLIEQDVCLSADGTLYVSHDRSEVEGRRNLDIIKPTLADVFDRFREDKAVTFVVELKSVSDEATDALIDLVREYELEDRVIVQSFDAGVLKRVSGVFDDMEIMYLINANNVANGQPSFEDALSKDYITVIAVDENKASMMTRERCNTTHKQGKKFGAFILTTEHQVMKAIDMGVEYYFVSGFEVTPSRVLELEEQR